MTLLTRIGAACALTVTIAAGVAYAQSDVIKERQDGFQAIRKQLGAVKATVEGVILFPNSLGMISTRPFLNTPTQE